MSRMKLVNVRIPEPELERVATLQKSLRLGDVSDVMRGALYRGLDVLEVEAKAAQRAAALHSSRLAQRGVDTTD